MADVFVSYARSNRDRVALISGGLERRGYSLWWDRRLVSGADYGMEIEQEIQAAACVVVAWSAAARQSLWVRAEANEALDSGKLVQIALDESRLPLPFTMLHFLDFSRWDGSDDGPPWTDLEGRIGRVKAGEPTEDIVGAMPVRRDSLRGPALQGLGTVAMLGWASLLLSAAIAMAVILAARGGLSQAAFGAITLIALGAAALLLGATALGLLRIQAASRR
jgi:hypothetical protein